MRRCPVPVAHRRSPNAPTLQSIWGIRPGVDGFGVRPVQVLAHKVTQRRPAALDLQGIQRTSSGVGTDQDRWLEYGYSRDGYSRDPGNVAPELVDASGSVDRNVADEV